MVQGMEVKLTQVKLALRLGYIDFEYRPTYCVASSNVKG